MLAQRLQLNAYDFYITIPVCIDPKDREGCYHNSFFLKAAYLFSGINNKNWLYRNDHKYF